MDMKIWFLKLFSAFLRNEHIEEKETPWTEEEGEKLLQLATYHNVVAIIYEAAMKQALFSSFSPELLGTWRKLAMVSVAKQANRTHEFLQLYDKMIKGSKEHAFKTRNIKKYKAEKRWEYARRIN